MEKIIKIKKAKLAGINNPSLQIYGYLYDDSYKFRIDVDNKAVPFDLQYYKHSNEFIINVTLNKKNKKIDIYIEKDKKHEKVLSIKNNLLKRIYNRFYSFLYSIVNSIIVFFGVLGRGIRYFWKEYHFLIPPSLWKKYFIEFFQRIKVHDLNLYYNPLNVLDYNKWLKLNNVKVEYRKLSYMPKISVIIPVYNIGKEYLSQCIDSILNQSYSNFEICLVDDCSTNQETKETLKEYEKIDERVKVKFRNKNGHISKASNDALKMATGEFVALVDNDDTLDEDAFYEMVSVLNQNKKIDMIYSDEDKINLNGQRCDPNFKSDFAPDSLLSSNYICHLVLLRKSIVDEIGGFRVGYEGAQDYDLFLRYTEKTNRIYHIPKILYHWRMVPGSTSMEIDNKSYALNRGKQALEDALKRRNIKGIVHIANNVPYYHIEYAIKNSPKVMIIIPTRDYADITEKCLMSIYNKTTYKNFEVCLVNNNSEKKETFELFEKYKKLYKNFQVIDANFEFNYSRLNNLAVEKTKSDFIVLLNNDTEIITPNWLEILLGYASQEHVGAVGVKLLYPDNTVQHAGIILGIGGVAAHAFVNCRRDEIVWGGRLSVPYNYGAVTAACLMVDRKKYNEVNGLEEELQVAFNDVDFNLKLLKKGYYNIVVPQVEVYHYESKSRGLDDTPEKYKRFVFEVNYMTNKWNEILKRDPFYNENYSLHKPYMLDKKKNED